MAGELKVGEAVIAIGVDTKGLDAGMKNLGQQMTKAGKNLSMKVTAPLAIMAGLAIKTAADYSKAMAKVNAVTGATAEEFKQLQDISKELGRTTQFTASQVADAMGFMGMAGMDANTIMAAIPDTLNLAAAGALDMGQAADIVTNVMAGFGMEADQLGMAVDTMSLAFTSSNTSLAQLGEAMSYAAPVAKGFGLSFAETNAIIGSFSNAGIQASQAGTSLRGAIVKLDKGAKDYGITMYDTAGKMLPMADILEQLENRGITASEAMDLFGLRAGPAMMALLETGSDALREFTGELENSGGTAERIAKTQMEGLHGMLITLKSAFEGVQLAIVDALMPVLKPLLEGLTKLLRMFTSLPAPIKTIAVMLGVAAAAAGPLLIVMGYLLQTVAGLQKNLPMLGKALGSLAGKLKITAIATKLLGMSVKGLLVGTGIGALLVIFGLLAMAMMKNEKVMATLREAFDKIMAAFQPLFDALSNAVTLIMDALAPAFDALAKVLGMVVGIIADVFAKVVTWLVNIIMPPLVWIIEKVAWALEKLVDAAMWVWDKLKILFLKGVRNLLNVLNVFIGWVPWLGGKIKAAKEIIDNMIDGEGIKKQAGIAGEGLNDLGETAEEAADRVAKAMEQAEAANKLLVDTYTEGAEERIQALRDEYGDLESIVEEGEKTKLEILRESHAEQLEILEQGLQDAKDNATERIDALKEEYGDVLGFVKKNEKSKLALLEKSHNEVLRMLDRELEAAKKAYNERIKLLDEEYDARLRLLDEDTRRQLEEYQRQIDGIEGLTEEEERIIKQTEDAKRLEELRTEIARAENAEERFKAQEAYNEELEEQHRESVLAKRDEEIDAIRDAMDAVEEKRDDEALVLKEEYDEKKRIEGEKLIETEARLTGEIEAQQTHFENMKIELGNELAAKIKIEEDKLEETTTRLESEIQAHKDNLPKLELALKAELDLKIQLEKDKLQETLDRLAAELAAEKQHILDLEALRTPAVTPAPVPGDTGGTPGGVPGQVPTPPPPPRFPEPGTPQEPFVPPADPNRIVVPPFDPNNLPPGYTLVDPIVVPLPQPPPGTSRYAEPTRSMPASPNMNETQCVGGDLYQFGLMGWVKVESDSFWCTSERRDARGFAEGGMLKRKTFLKDAAGRVGVAAEREAEILSPLSKLADAITAAIDKSILNPARGGKMGAYAPAIARRDMSPAMVGIGPGSEGGQGGDVFNFHIAEAKMQTPEDIRTLAREFYLNYEREKRRGGI